ncbi:MAG: hypothetical protein COT16_02610 [Elusimicrobia bacterium CG08_land_8_20_14_0_20_44_26]|nr:MAG: hypothetical protein COT16_02610 [Elusimicrobia bacterium CG08_land_8_20_14_0_20_44_26]
MTIILSVVCGALFVKYLGLNIFLGIIIGLLFGMGLAAKYFLKGKALVWLFHTVYIFSYLAMIFLLAEYVSGEIVSVCALWAAASALFSYRERRLTILSSSSSEKK